MKRIKYPALGSVILALGACSYDGFTSHHLVAAEPYAAQVGQLTAAQKLELREYLNYEQREPCQNYRPVPQPFIRTGCNIGVRVAEVVEQTPPPAPAPQQTVVQTTQETTLRPIITDYKIHFDFDRYNIRASEQPVLTRVSQEIKTYDPYEVTIAGYADRSGPNDYNYTLSQKRAQSVSSALTALGIENRILDQEAYGETNNAVPTPDGVKLEENRRVEIQFRK